MQGLRKLILPFRALGWALIVVVVAVQVIERTGLATRWVEEWLQARLGSMGADLALAEVDVHWMEPAVVFTGFAVTDHGELLAADEVRVSLDLFGDGGARVSHVEVDGGRLRYGPRLVNSLRGLFDLSPAKVRKPEDDRAPRPLPSMRVRRVALSIEAPDGAAVPLGELAFDLDARSTEDAELAGRFRLASPKGYRNPEVLLRGRALPGGRLNVESWGRDLDLAAWAVPELPALETLAQLEPRGTLSMSSSGSISLTGLESPQGRLRVSLQGGAVALPFEDQRVEEVDVDLELAYAPGDEQDLWTPGSWAGRGALAGRWEGHRFDGGLRVGRASTAGTFLEQWTRLQRLPVGDPLLELLGKPRELSAVDTSIEAEGHVDLTVALRLFDTWTPDAPPLSHLETLALFEDAGDIDMSWLGWPRLDGRPPYGFPMPAHVESARGAFAYTPRLARRNYLGLKVAGRHKGGPVDLRFYTWSPRVDLSPLAPGYGMMETDLLIESEGIAVDEDLRVALAGLGDIEPALTAWDDYAPAGGVSAGQLRVSSRAEFPFPVTHVRVQLEGLSVTPRVFPVAFERVDGELEVLTDGDEELAIRFDADGFVTGGDRVRLQGRLRAPSDPLSTDGPPELEVAQLRATAVDFEGPVRTVLDDVMPDVGAVIDEYAPQGRADLFATLLRRRGAPAREFGFRIVPSGSVAVTPVAFPVRADAVRGAVLVRAETPFDPERLPVVTTRVPVLRGEWPGHIAVSFRGDFLPDRPGTFRLRGAGLRLFAEGERGARPTVFLRQLDATLAAATGASLIEAAEEESISVLGNVDFETSAEISTDTTDAVPGEHSFHLRGARFDAGSGMHLDDITGHFDVADGEVTDGTLSGIFADTRVDADRLRLVPEDGGFRLDLDFRAAGVPLDAEHLGVLLDEKTTRALFDELAWRGRLDVPEATMTLEQRADGRREMRMSGDVVLSDCFLDLGLPLAFRSANGRVERLVVDAGGVHGWGRIEDLYGQIAERELGPASMLVSYHGSRLSIDELEGVFERGTVRGLVDGASEHVRPATALAVDLVEPFPFLLAVELERVEVARLLEGVFAENIADRGDLDARLRLSGRLDDPLSLEGYGGGELTQTRLWSVPVFRDLFSQLGYDATAVFDSMTCRFRLRDGRATLDEVHVHSPLFSLEGDGELDLDGSLSMDLELRYSLVDKVEILTELVYLVQNTLLEVAIRGDLSRPQVYLQGAWTRLFQDVDGDPRGLPLPRQSELPARF